MKENLKLTICKIVLRKSYPIGDDIEILKDTPYYTLLECPTGEHYIICIKDQLDKVTQMYKEQLLDLLKNNIKDEVLKECIDWPKYVDKYYNESEYKEFLCLMDRIDGYYYDYVEDVDDYPIINVVNNESTSC